MAKTRVVIVTLASLAIGCGLVSGLDSLSVGDASVGDGAIDGGADVVLPQCDGGCGLSLPSGFALVTFATVATTCPDGTNPQAVVADPTVAPSACSCKCTMTTKGTCTAQNVELFIGDGGLSSCTTSFMSLVGTPGCHPASFTLPTNTRLDNSGPTGILLDAGACGTSTVSDASTLATTPAQVCGPTSCTSASLCAPPAGQRLCAAANGDVSCPAPFTEKHVVGTSASVACSACSSACTINPQTCTNGKLTLYSSTNCSTSSQNTSGCFSIGAQMDVKSYDYVMTAAGGCTTSATSSASTSLTSEQTVCCRPGM